MMIKRLTGLLAILILSVSLVSCVEPFFIPETAHTGGMLVIDGGLNVEQRSGRIILSRTQQLNTAEPASRVSSATVKAETESGEVYIFRNQGNGEFYIEDLNLEYGKKYRLRVNTEDGKEYLSEFVSTGKTPEIDALTWDVERNGVQVMVNTHDPENLTRYYRWEYVETYEYNSGAEESYRLINGEVVQLEPEDRKFVCWKTEPASKIIIGNTVKLEKDVILSLPIAFHQEGSRQISRRYSILVRQIAISKEEFEYWETLKKNTESMGSLFDAQPSQLTGNFRNTEDPDEQVFGYFSVNSVVEKRLFISPNELLALKLQPFKPYCKQDSISVGEVSKFLRYRVLISEIHINGALWGYRTADGNCSDCSNFGGDLLKPDFWE